MRNIFFKPPGKSKAVQRRFDLTEEKLTLGRIRCLVQECCEEFSIKSFSLSYRSDGAAVTSSPTKGMSRIFNDEDIYLYINSTTPLADLKFSIESECKGFNEFTLEQALTYAGASNVSEPTQDDKKFPRADFDENDVGIKAILDQATAEIICRIPIFGPLTAAKNEASVRELLGPVLVAGARICQDIRIISEKRIVGSRGNGPVDYDMLYKNFNIVITEAKKDSVENGICQNIAQLVGGREDYLYSRAPNKRIFAEYADLINDVPSSGVVSTADRWIFTQYVNHTVYCSDTYNIPLRVDTSEAALKLAMTEVVRVLVGVLRMQKDAVDNNKYTSVEGPLPPITVAE